MFVILQRTACIWRRSARNSKDKFVNLRSKNELLCQSIQTAATYIFGNLYACVLKCFYPAWRILSSCETCLNLVNFMKSVLPAVEVFYKVNSMPEIAAFYTSHMSLLTIIYGILLSTMIIFVKDTEEKEEMGMFMSIFCIGMGICGLHMTYIGDIAIEGIESKSVGIAYLAKLQSRVEIFFDVNIYQLMMMASFVFAIGGLKSFFKAYRRHIKETKQIANDG